jgi:hypothetical protein
MSRDDIIVPNKSVLVNLSEEDLALADDIAEARVAPYLRGEKWEVKPWRLHELTEDECREWLPSRKEAGREIDVGTCEIGRWYVNWIDAYGIVRRPRASAVAGTLAAALASALRAPEERVALARNATTAGG